MKFGRKHRFRTVATSNYYCYFTIFFAISSGPIDNERKRNNERYLKKTKKDRERQRETKRDNERKRNNEGYIEKTKKGRERQREIKRKRQGKQQINKRKRENESWIKKGKEAGRNIKIEDAQIPRPSAEAAATRRKKWTTIVSLLHASPTDEVRRREKERHWNGTADVWQLCCRIAKVELVTVLKLVLEVELRRVFELVVVVVVML